MFEINLVFYFQGLVKVMTLCPIETLVCKYLGLNNNEFQ